MAVTRSIAGAFYTAVSRVTVGGANQFSVRAEP